ncbi:MAG: hypothetical protein IK130_05170 [Oscillospiraceae bacterium]|nr:hypothetical protein [Oscillospiraceae bacterium]
MQKSEIHDIQDYHYTGSKVDYIYDNGIAGWFSDEERERTGFVRFSFQFNVRLNSKNAKPDMSSLKTGGEVTIKDITAAETADGYAVTVTTETNTVSFVCDYFYSHLECYDGTSYKNIFPEREEPELSEEWFEGEHTEQITDGLELVRRHYCRKWFNAEGKLTGAHSFCTYRLLKNGNELHAWTNIDDQVTLREPLIQHSSGRQYYAYHVDLYGISYIDTETGEHYDYVPEGFSHDYRTPCGESFIITDIHYDRDSDLIAYGGCYWAGPGEVFAGDFTNPLHYNPHLLRIPDILEEITGEEYEGDDVDFVRWEHDALIVKMNKQEIAVSKSMIWEKVQNGASDK